MGAKRKVKREERNSNAHLDKINEWQKKIKIRKEREEKGKHRNYEWMEAERIIK